MTIPRVASWPVPATWQFQLGSLVIGDGTPYQVEQVEGLRGVPSMRSVNAARAGAHGSLGGQDFSDVRNLIFHITVLPRPGDPGLPTLLDTLEAAFRPGGIGSDDVGLTAVIPGWGTGSQLFVGRGSRCSVPMDSVNAAGRAARNVLAQFTALDPLIYSADLQDALISAPTAGVNAGITFARGSGTQGIAFARATPPQGISFGAAGGSEAASGYVYLTNNGSASMAPVTRINGPVDTPILERVESGEAVQLDYVIAAGDYVELDHDLHTVMLNGVQSRQDILDSSSDWWALAPGLNTIHYHAFGSAVGSSVDIKWRHAGW